MLWQKFHVQFLYSRVLLNKSNMKLVLNNQWKFGCNSEESVVRHHQKVRKYVRMEVTDNADKLKETHIMSSLHIYHRPGGPSVVTRAGSAPLLDVFLRHCCPVEERSSKTMSVGAKLPTYLVVLAEY